VKLVAHYYHQTLSIFDSSVCVCQGMGYSVAIGCALLGFSPPIIMTSQIVFKRPVLTVIAVIAAAFWLLSCLATALVWIVVPVFKGKVYLSLIVGTLFQEVTRALLMRSYGWLAEIVNREKSKSVSSLHLNQAASAIAAGVGFGCMHILVVYGSLLGASISRATLFVDTCPSLPLILVSGE
jgi:hypothetical protein